jgi:hypothetical protein
LAVFLLEAQHRLLAVLYIKTARTFIEQQEKEEKDRFNYIGTRRFVFFFFLKTKKQKRK